VSVSETPTDDEFAVRSVRFHAAPDRQRTAERMAKNA